ncbi:60S ribosomal protein L24, partial [Lemmus lemmus]
QVELYSFSRYKIYPGHRQRYARTDLKVSQFLLKAKMRVLIPGQKESLSDKLNFRRNSKEKKLPRSQIPAGYHSYKSLADIVAKRNQKLEEEAKKAKQASKKTAMAAVEAPIKASPKQKIVKPVKVSAPRAGGKR